MKYRKTTLVEAVQTIADEEGYATWDEEKDVPGWLIGAVMNGTIFKSYREKTMKIVLREGTVNLKAGSWIVRGANGALWPLDASSFAESYEKVE